MRKKDDAALREELDRLGREWGSIKAEDDGIRRKTQEDIFCTACEMYPQNTDEISTVFMEDWSKFDPSKGSLSGFFAARIKWRKEDMQRWERSERRAMETDPLTGEKKWMYRSAVVQGPETDMENGVSPWDTAQASLRQGNDGNTEEDVFWVNEKLLQIMIMVMELSSRLTGQANNADRQEYYRMFFTDNVTTCLHEWAFPALFRKRERDLFQAMEVRFLDYFMAEQCRTAAAIQQCGLKKYGQLVQGESMEEETTLPLPNNVFTTYLERILGKKAGVSAVSNQKKAYRAFIRDNLS